MADQSRVYVFAPLYMLPDIGSPTHFQQLGFAFRQKDGKCLLGPPFPASLVDEVEARAQQSVAAN